MDYGGDKQLTGVHYADGVHYAEWVVRMAKQVQAELHRRALCGVGRRAKEVQAELQQRAIWVVRMAREVQAELQQRATLNAESDAMVVCLHVRRGDKLSDNFKKSYANLDFETSYPNLDYETSPDGIRAAIERLVPHGSVLFIATNEPDPVAFFAPLGAYYEVLSLAHFAERLNTTRFLPSSLALVDYQRRHTSRFLPSSLALVDYQVRAARNKATVRGAVAMRECVRWINTRRFLPSSLALVVMDHCSYQIPTFANEDSHGFGRHITLSASNKQLVHR
ncbi:hypothetical protein JKP88DRAFT_283043 [Tribonema minus]|uniref:Uncharacterized protein n=1 Tax=Tribonema minus TaxID=303371 RepID=A0A835YJ14_9STRA|nr:hypothetical protein JKP88DRAFT_283043 [Tribonema minus]